MKKSLFQVSQIIFLTLSLFLLGVSILTIRAAGEVDALFNPAITNSNSTINRMIMQPDGKVLVAGSFMTVGKSTANSLARLNADGTLDATFRSPSVSICLDLTVCDYGAEIKAIALQTDGKILIGGDFYSVNRVLRPLVARLNADGSLDESFILDNPVPGQSLYGTVLDIKVSADNKITFAGKFTFTSSGIAHKSIARVSNSGVIDNTFASPPSIATDRTKIYRVELLSDGKILIGGGTETSIGNYPFYETYTGFINRLNADGTVDTAFTPFSTRNGYFGGLTRSAAVVALKVQADGKFLAGGGFIEMSSNPSKQLIRFNANGSIDTTFSLTAPEPNGIVNDIEILQDGRIITCGDFSTVGGATRKGVAILSNTGSIDNSLIYSESQLRANDILALPNGKFFVGGITNQITSATFTPSLIRINANGSTDSAFNLMFGGIGTANKVLTQPDGKILIGGIFSHTDNKPNYNLSRVNADGTIDNTFRSAITNDIISNLDIRGDGKIMVGTSGKGAFRLNSDGSLDINFTSNVGNVLDAKFLAGGGAVISINKRLRKYSEQGVFDTSFDLLANGDITRILIQPDGKFIIVGNFNQVGGVERRRIARVNADGTLDQSFNPSVGATSMIYIVSVFDAALQSDGKIVVGGNFPDVNSNTAYKYLARINADGSLDTNFNPIVEGGVQSLRVQPNNRILVGGSMYSVNGLVSRIVRLNQNGTLDTSFQPGYGPDNSVLSIDLTANGNAVIGGTFKRVNNIDRIGVAQLVSSNVKTVFDFDGDGKADISVFRSASGAWYLNQSSAGFAGISFGQSGDKLVPADFDGDGKTDVAVVRNGTWYLQRSTAGFTGTTFGDGNDIPVPADYDGDGKSEIAVFRPSNGYWYILNLVNNQFTATLFGQNGDKPVPADYDGDGKADVAVNRNGNWYLNRSQLGFTGILFGDANDKLVPADYDGDGKADIAVFRPSNGSWYIQQSQAGFTGLAFGLGTDIPAAADFDGDGKADIAVVRNGNWYLNRTTQGFTGIAFGTSTDLPIPNVFVR